MSTEQIDEGTTGVRVPAVTLLAGPLRVRRSIHVQQSGLVVRLEIQPRRSITAERVVVDSLPMQLEVDAIGFHPDHEPAVGSIDSQRTIVSGIAGATDPIEVSYGLCPSRPLRPETVSSLQDSAEISVEVHNQDDGQAPSEFEHSIEKKKPTTLLLGRVPIRAANRLRARFDLV